MRPADDASRDDHWSDELIALLERQRGVVGKLLELARYQGSLIENGRTEPLLGLLGQRQALIDEFTSTQEALAASSEDLERRMKSLADDKQVAIASLIDEIGGQLGEIIEHDEQDQRSLADARDRARDELAVHGAARQARNAYTRPGPSGTPGPKFTDRQG